MQNSSHPRPYSKKGFHFTRSKLAVKGMYYIIYVGIYIYELLLLLFIYIAYIYTFHVFIYIFIFLYMPIYISFTASLFLVK